MNRKLVSVAALVLVAGAAVALVGPLQRHFTPAPAAPTAPTSSHAAGMDHAMRSVLVMYKAPPGDTPCESAYNAFKASLDVSTQEHVIPFVLSLQPHDVFIARCNALPAQTQQCLLVAYKAQHQSECDRARPSREQFASLVELKGEDKPASPAAPPDPAEPPPIGSR
jgi:hypothetical protein